MRLHVRPLACILVLLLSGCATVRTTTGPNGPGVGPDGGPPMSMHRDASGAAAFPQGDRDGYRPPARLAVLLPLSGSLANAGGSVRDGLLASYYAETRPRPQIRFFDTHGTPAGATKAFDDAIGWGTQLVLGPLTRDEVGALFSRGHPTVPVIALNRGPAPPPPGSVSFALAPDDEGIAAAERLAQRGTKRVFAFVQRDDNSQRSLAALRARLRELGGDVVGERVVDDAVTPELAIQFAGEAAAAHADGVFLALKAAPARALATAMRASPAMGAPRVSTSLVLNGASASKDVALDGVEFPELPWLLGGSSALPSPGAVNLSSARGPSQRLFAFGSDAWSLVAWYERLWLDPGFALGGATGQLRVDDRGQVRHTPAWAEFAGGKPRLAARLPELPPGR